MKENKSEIIQNSYDELIKAGMDMDFQDIDNIPVMTDEEMLEKGYSLPPEDMFERIMAKLKEEDKPKSKRRFGYKKIFIVAAVLVTMTFGTLCVKGGPKYFLNIINEISGNSIQFVGINQEERVYEADEAAAYKTAEEGLGKRVLKPAYLPENMKFTTIKVYPKDHIILMYRSQDYLLKITQSLIKGDKYTGEAIDTKDGSTFTMKVNGINLTIAKHNQEETDVVWYEAVWNDEELMYSIDTNLDEKELKKVISNLN